MRSESQELTVGFYLHDTDAEHQNQVDLLTRLELESEEHWNGQADDP